MITPFKIKTAVKALTGVKRKEMSGKLRTKHIVFARHIAMYLCRRLTDRSLPAIGKSFNRDHASVVHAVNKVEAELQKGSSKYSANVSTLTEWFKING